jgi:hypothetical protein
MAVYRGNVDWVDRRFALGSWVDQEVKCIEIVLTGNADQREQGMVRAAPIRCGVRVSLVGQTGQSERDPFTCGVCQERG